MIIIPGQRIYPRALSGDGFTPWRRIYPPAALSNLSTSLRCRLTLRLGLFHETAVLQRPASACFTGDHPCFAGDDSMISVVGPYQLLLFPVNLFQDEAASSKFEIRNPKFLTGRTDRSDLPLFLLLTPNHSQEQGLKPETAPSGSKTGH
jgi:hypothetical protein